MVLAPAAPAIFTAPVLTVTAVGKSYGARAVLADVSFSVAAGERIALTGPSGSGKTTLLNCLGGVDRPDTGTIALHGERIDALPSDGLARLRRERVGTVFQFFHLLATLTAAENVELPLQLTRVPAPERAARVAAALTRVGLTARAAALPAQLSGGEQQRVAIARALVHRPALILADEPTGNLDTRNAAAVFDIFARLAAEEGRAILVVTHDAELAKRANRRIHLVDGRIVSDTRAG